MIISQQEIKENLERLKDFTSGVLIWSGEWGLYWRPDGKGYTSDINEAGSYSPSGAWGYISHVGPEKKISLIHDYRERISEDDIHDNSDYQRKLNGIHMIMERYDFQSRDMAEDIIQLFQSIEDDRNTRNISINKPSNRHNSK